MLATASLELKAEKQSAHSKAVTFVGFSADGATIVSGSCDGTIKVWELKTVQKTKKNWRGKTIKVWDAGIYLSPPYSSPSPKLSAPMLVTASLELKAEKQSAHSSYVTSVAFSPDGVTIVSGSDDKTIKVWDAVNFRPHVESEWEQFYKTVEYEYCDFEEEWWRNKVTGHEQASTKPSGGAPLGH